MCEEMKRCLEFQKNVFPRNFCVPELSKSKKKYATHVISGLFQTTLVIFSREIDIEMNIISKRYIVFKL